MTVRENGNIFEETFQTSIVAAGAYEVLCGGGGCTDVVVAGRGASAGRVEHWRRTMGQPMWVLDSALTVPGCDFTGVAYAGSSIYLLDCVSKTILSGLWLPTQPLASVVTSVYLAQSDVPSLQDARWQYLYSLPPGSPGVSGDGIFLVHIACLGEAMNGTLIHETLTGTTAEPYFFNPLQGIGRVTVDERFARAGDTVLKVICSGASSFEVLDGLGTVIGSGVASGSGTELVALSSPLALGETYSVRETGSSLAASFRCVERHGFPEAFVDGATMERMALSPVDYNIGNSTFAIYCPLSRQEYNGPELFYIGAMLLGLGGTPIVPFDNGQGPNEVLFATYYVGAIGGVAANARSGHVGMELPLPNDPSWVGITILGQFIMFDAAGFRFSEVIGFVVQP